MLNVYIISAKYIYQISGLFVSWVTFQQPVPNLLQDWTRLKTMTISSLSDVTSHFQDDCYLLLASANNSSSKQHSPSWHQIKAAVHVCATQMSIKTPLHTDTCDLKETVENVMNLSRQMRRQYVALQYHNALEIWITTDTTGRSYEVWFHLSGLFYFVF